MRRALAASGQARDGFAQFLEGGEGHTEVSALYPELYIDCTVLTEKSSSIQSGVAG